MNLLIGLQSVNLLVRIAVSVICFIDGHLGKILVLIDVNLIAFTFFLSSYTNKFVRLD